MATKKVKRAVKRLAPKKAASGMVRRRLELDFPAKLVTQPILYDLVKAYDLRPNIRRATVTQEFGYMLLELEGKPKDLEAGLRYLAKRGVRVEPIVKDVLES